jgi:hypothetical protein
LDSVISRFLKLITPIFILIRRLGTYRLPKSSAQIGHITRVLNVNSYYGFFEQQFREAFERNALRNRASDIRIDFRIEEQLQFINSIQPSHISRIQKLIKSLESSDQFSKGGLSNLDLIVTLGFIKEIQPKTIIQVGNLIKKDLVSHEFWNDFSSGWSSQDKASIRAPHSKKFGLGARNYLEIPGLDECESDLFGKLEESDLVIVDYRNCMLNEVNPIQLFIRILPQIPKGVYVLFNDVYTPYEYLDAWAGWGDSGLLADKILNIFLSNEDNYQVTLSLNLLAKDYSREVEKVFGLSDPQIESSVLIFKTK